MEKGNYAAACAKFDASNKADPAIGTQLNLAGCWEKVVDVPGNAATIVVTVSF